MTQKITQTLEFRQQQNLVMTPQMQQAVKLLQMSNLELQDFIDAEITQNPLLERVEKSDDTGDGEIGEMDQSLPDQNPELSEAGSLNSNKNDAEFESQFMPQENIREDFDSGSKMAEIGGSSHKSFDDDLPQWEDTLRHKISLRDHLLAQLHMSFHHPKDISLGSLLIDRLDPDGYLREDLSLLCTQFGCDTTVISDLLARLKKFDPTGVFAADLGECLGLQWGEETPLTPAQHNFLKNLTLLAQHEYKKLAEICNCPVEKIHEMAAAIKRLNPKPAADFESFIVQTALPDILMKQIPKNMGGGWRVELNSDTLPRVLINRDYYNIVLGHAKNKQEKEYLAAQLNNANWLVKALDQRAQSILKVASDIVERQNGFFLYGIDFLKPMTLREVAESVDLHESTVSRVTTGKFIGTPRGLFELKFFFTSAIEGADGVTLSSQSVKSRIKQLIDAEDPKNILSDDDLADTLKKEGIFAARRTVAKYRESLHIPSSVQRRRAKNLGKN